METRWRHDSERLNSQKPISFFSGALSMFVLTVVQGYAHHVFSLWYRLLRCLNRVCLYRLSAVTTNWLSVVNDERPHKPQEIPSWTGPIESLKFLWLHWSNLTLKQVFKKVSIALFCTVCWRNLLKLFIFYELISDVLESTQAKGVDTVEQPIQAQQSQSVLNESEPSSKASTPQQPSHQTSEPEPEPEPAAGTKKALASLAVKSDSAAFSLVLSFVALLASLLYNKY